MAQYAGLNVMYGSTWLYKCLVWLDSEQEIAKKASLCGFLVCKIAKLVGREAALPAGYAGCINKLVSKEELTLIVSLVLGTL